MSFLDKLFGSSKYLNREIKADKPAENAAVEPEKPEVSENAEPAPVFTETEPDFPVPFGYKCSWLCVKANSPEEVIEKLGLKNPQISNWDKGIEMAYNGYDFVSPVLDGYVLVVGWGTDVLTLAPELLSDSAKKFPELQYFATQRVVDYHVWVKFVNGEMIRGYGWCGCDGELLMNSGELTAEEKKLGFTNLLPSAEANFDDFDFPDEDHVLEIAAAWGVDPSFRKEHYEKSTGFICK